MSKSSDHDRDTATLRLVGIDPDKLTRAEVKRAAGLLGQITRNHCFPGANARRPLALADLEAMVAASKQRKGR